MATIDDIRVGTIRPTMDTNCLLQKAELGKPKKLLFNKPGPEVVFGVPGRSGLEESARDIIMSWKDGPTGGETTGGAGAAASASIPDFRTMNKLAVNHGLTKAKEQRDFRSTHYVKQQPPWEKVAAQRQVPDLLPSDMDANFTYGCPSTHKPLEVQRRTGEDCAMQDLIQGRFHYEWVARQMDEGAMGAQGGASRGRSGTRHPALTLAAQGHAKGAAKKLVEQQPPTDLWKMKKFGNVDPKTNSHNRGRSFSPGRPQPTEHAAEVLQIEG